MNLQFTPVEFEDIRVAVKTHLTALPGKIDSFLEDHILTSSHYRVMIDNQIAGFTSVHGNTLITQFALDPPFRHLGQSVFIAVRNLEQVNSAFVPTCDEFFLSHALDDFRVLAKQAYFFAAGNQKVIDSSFTFRSAESSDLELISRETGDFFAPLEHRFALKELFVTTRGDVSVGFGLIEQSRIYDRVASIGMFTIERHRGSGVGTATISNLMREARLRNLEPIAGCWYYNHLSKRTLERAGMISPTRLLKIDF